MNAAQLKLQIQFEMEKNESIVFDWWCAVALSCYESLGKEYTDKWRHRIAQEAAHKFMKEQFGFDTTHWGETPKSDQEGGTHAAR